MFVILTLALLNAWKSVQGQTIKRGDIYFLPACHKYTGSWCKMFQLSLHGLLSVYLQPALDGHLLSALLPFFLDLSLIAIGSSSVS